MRKTIITLIAAALIGTGAYTASDLIDPPAQPAFQPGAVVLESSREAIAEESPESSAQPPETVSAISTYPVVRVIDGDTIAVEIDGITEKVRLIGIDTPESVHPDQDRNVPYGEISSAFTQDQLEDQTVGLEYDVQERDKYGRLLAYVYLGSKMFNETLLEEGHAVVSTYPPNVKYVERFTALQRQARETGLGLWAVEPMEATPIQDSPAADYIGNLNSSKFHYASCVHVGSMKDTNKIYFTRRDDAITKGYQPCKTCKP